MRACLGLLLLLAFPVAAGAQTSFSVTNSGLSAYLIGGQPNPTLTLERGKTYIFNVNAIGHPFYIKTAQVVGTGSQWTQGVTNNGVQSGQLTFVVPGNAPDELFYQCGVHAAMTGSLDIVNAVDVPPGGASATAWLGPAVPNPSRRGASFRFGLARGGSVDFALFDLHGRRVVELARGALPAGEHVVTWDGIDRSGRRAPSGLYYYRLSLEDRVLSGRLAVTH